MIDKFIIFKNKIRYLFFDIKNKNYYFFKMLVFKMSSPQKQQLLIAKNAYVFFGLQKEAKKLDDLGDTVEAMTVSSISYKYLGNLVDYCEYKKIDINKTLTYYE